MTIAIFTVDEWKSILSTIFNEIQPKNISLREGYLKNLLYFYATIGEYYNINGLLRDFTSNITSLSILSQFFCYRDILRNLFYLPHFNSISFHYFQLYLQSFQELFSKPISYSTPLDDLIQFFKIIISKGDDELSQEALNIYEKYFLHLPLEEQVHHY